MIEKIFLILIFNWNIRRVATEMAKQVVYRVMLLRKGPINVAREAYARKESRYI